MVAVVFLPGILGSRLALGGNEVWPPTAFEVVTGYRRIQQLLDPAVVATKVIESQCIPVYGPLLDALRGVGISEAGGNDLLVPWAYDWRHDLRDLADHLATQLDALAAHPGGIVLVCHSMGGLIARACLEAQANQGRPFQARINLAVFLATPHDGAPLAVARAMGTGGSSLGVNAADLRTLANDSRYPADFQLFPRSAEPVIWHLDSVDPLAPESLGSPSLSARMGLNPQSLAGAFAFQALLNPANKPPTRRYFSIVSAAHETMTRFDGNANTLAPVVVKTSGDGTVPITSAAALADQTAFVVADHMGVAKDDNAIQLVLMLLNKKPVVAILASAPPPPQPALSLSQSFIEAGQSYEILVLLPAAADQFVGQIAVRRVIAEGQVPETVLTIPINASAPGLDTLSLKGPGLDPGQYAFVLQVGGADGATRDLVVSPPSGAAS